MLTRSRLSRAARRCGVVVISLGVVASACSSSKSASSSSSSSSTAAAPAGSSSATSAPASNNIPSGDIKVGAIQPLSGPLAIPGTTVANAVKGYINQLNNAGGIDGHKVDLVLENDEGNPALAASLAEQLISQHVAAILGASIGPSLAQTLPIFMKAKVLVIDNDANDTFATQTSQYPYYFTTGPISKQDMAAMASYAKQKNLTKVGVVTDGLPFSAQLVSDFKASAAADGVTVAAVQNFSPTAVDVTPQLAALKAAGVDAVATLAETQLTAVYSAMKSLGMTEPILGNVVNTLFVPAPTGAVAPCYGPLSSGEAVPAGLATAIQVANAAEGSTPTSPGTDFEAADMVDIYALAVKNAGSLDTSAVQAALESMNNVAPVSPNYPYTFTASNHGGFAGTVTACDLNAKGPLGLPVPAS